MYVSQIFQKWRCKSIVSPKISVIMKDALGVASLSMPITIVVFEKKNALWFEKDRHYVNVEAGGGLGAMRLEIAKLIGSLGDCRIAAGSDITGVLYRELDRHGFSIFEIEDCSPETLDGILCDIDEANLFAGNLHDTPTKPVETETPGIYHLDLMRLQRDFPEMTSKEALREFLDTTPFYELRLVCQHIPPWLEIAPYEITSEQGGLAVHATIRKKQCKGG